MEAYRPQAVPGFASATNNPETSRQLCLVCSKAKRSTDVLVIVCLWPTVPAHRDSAMASSHAVVLQSRE